MIQYALKCDKGHTFDSWFKSAEAFESLRAAGHLACSVCGSPSVEKAIMAPRVTTGQSSVPADDTPEPAPSPLEQLRRHVEANADYVGGRFAEEARAMHLAEAPERPIYGEANRAEARALVEDGVPVAPLPFVPKPKTN